MDALILLIPLSLLLGLGALAAFLWALRSGQYDDLEGAAHRILFDEDAPPPRVAPRDRKEKSP
ncbi:MAG: cbb3-type cytochrome oxidase assembly protein CcoS [Acetobacteraceae bacterium]